MKKKWRKTNGPEVGVDREERIRWGFYQPFVSIDSTETESEHLVETKQNESLFQFGECLDKFDLQAILSILQGWLGEYDASGWKKKLSLIKEIPLR